jgi:tripartite-type tricarboxylate transporter receptor subunit TctC
MAKFPRRRFLNLAAGTVMLPVMPRLGRAQAYPTRPVHLIVGFPAATATDIVARLIAEALSERLRQQVIVENRTGAATNIAAEVVSKVTPDGYTLLALTITNAVNTTLYSGLTFDIKRDLAPVVGTFRSALALVITPSVPAKAVPELIAYAKANPGKINYASLGYGSTPNVNGELFKLKAGVDLVHVPYRGNPVPDLLAGQVQVMFGTLPSVISYIKAGTLRALAVTSAERSAALPDVPALAEFLPGFDTYLWHGIVAPRNTPNDIIKNLNKETNAVLAEPRMKTRFDELGGSAIGGTPEDFGILIASEIDKWGEVIRTANIKPE